MCKKIQPQTIPSYKLPIWYNPLVSTYPLFFPELYKKGINRVGDLLTDEGGIITKDELLNKTNLFTINPLNYFRLKSCIQSLLNTMLQPCIIQKPITPLLFSIATKSKKGSKEIFIRF